MESKIRATMESEIRAAREARSLGRHFAIIFVLGMSPMRALFSHEMC
jgi:hypothetical protein